MKVLVIHGAGMNMRGKVQTEVFGTLTLPEYDVKIREFAGALGMQVEIFHSNIQGEVINTRPTMRAWTGPSSIPTDSRAATRRS
jgi:3-dehydroquinate dehydratase